MYQKSRSCGGCFLRYGCNTHFSVILDDFLHFYPHYWPQKLETEKKRGYFLFHMCATNKDSWDIRCKRIWCTFPEIWSSTGKIFSHFGPFFVLLLKNKNFEWKKPGDFISSHLCTTNDNDMMYGSLDISCNKQSFLWTIICLLWHPPPKKTKALENQNFDKMKQKKKFLGILSFVPGTHKWKSYNV